MDRRKFSMTVAAGVAGSLLGAQTSRAAARVNNVVLVHGLYADGSSWSECIVRLQVAGITVTAVQNPLTSFADDVAATRRALAMQNGPTVLAAHSYGGMVATQAGVAPNVTALVYIAARAPDAGEDYTALAKRFPTPPASAGLVTVEGFSRLTRMRSSTISRTASSPSRPTSFTPFKRRMSPRSRLRRGRLSRPGGPNRPGMPSRSKIGRSTRTWNVSWRRA
jgi:pimeloyl-ACP methyl ester carboxylesterase